MTVEAPEAIALTAQEWRIYEVLRAAMPAPVTYEQLVEALGASGSTQESARALCRTWTYRLRTKLGADSIRTLTNWGYRLTREVPVQHKERA